LCQINRVAFGLISVLSLDRLSTLSGFRQLQRNFIVRKIVFGHENVEKNSILSYIRTV